MSIYKLRPHHGMCIHYFIGKGYSEDFIDNMSKTIKILKSNVDIQLTSDVDVICSCCPNNNRNICESNKKVLNYDQNILTECGLKNGQILNSKDFLNLVFDKIISQNKLNKVCKDCEWLKICESIDPIR